MISRLALVFVTISLFGQLTTGTINGFLRGPDGHPVAGPIVVRGSTGFQTIVQSDSTGEFALTLPYGRYRLSDEAETVVVSPGQTTRVDLVIDASGTIRLQTEAPRTGVVYPEAFNLPGLLLSREPSSVTEPLNFTGLKDYRLSVVSQRGVSWTATQFKFQGLDVTDAYQPGLPMVFPDVQSLHAVETGMFLAEPAESWHGALSTTNTGSPLSSTNLPTPADRGLVKQADRFRRFTRDRLELGGPLARWIDLYASGTGQWASQTEPLADPGTNQQTQLLFGNARVRMRPGEKDQFDALYSGSRVRLSSGGIPAGLEALTGNRMAPSFVLPGRFSNQPENDRFDLVQLGWTRNAFEMRYGYSMAHLDTTTSPLGESRIELAGGQVSGTPPLANLAVRSRQEIAAAWHPSVLRAKRTRHQIGASGAWKTSEARNRLTAPSDKNLITANGADAFVMEFNTPVDSRERVRSFTMFAADHLGLTPSLSLDLGAVADFQGGSLPAQPKLIAWKNVSPHAGFSCQVPYSRGLLLRGSFSRSYAPLAARYLDFGNPNALGGVAYGESGNPLFRFGGPYSSISPSLQRPYSDEFNVGAEFPITRRSVASIHLFRRDYKNRIAVINTGLGDQAFTPVSILDPGPDGIPGTFDDQRLTVYAQDPATLGRDRYLLSNPDGLRMLNAGMLAELRTEWRRIALHASFMAVKSYGPANPGNAADENDPGIVGALFQDPNTNIHSAGRSFLDRAYVGKIQGSYRMPAAWGGIDLTSVADYLDGQAFARQLLVTGLPQGPFLVAATVRGSPEGGNRTQYVFNWNLRIGRQFELARGRFLVSADVLNVLNGAHRLQEDDRSGPLFNQRLPLAIQAPRFLRVGVQYEF